ncbi:MAG TPA: branched-chain amino acid transporter AzlC [Lachnospiraceae bacterium]|nr:branched-chain amino acid transporter AzlC [Lachnospiraceae bacterium]
MCSYFFLGAAYGIMMEETGFPWYVALLLSMTVYTGAFQFVLITFLSTGASLLTIAITALLMNSRQSFYSLTFLNDFKRMGKRKLYMIHSLTDETYAVNCTLELPRKEKEDTMFGVALLSHCYWMAATVAGAVLGQLIPFELEGIDFCMTALFVIIFMDQWKKASSHIPALAGLTCGIVCLMIFGQSSFILPALLLVSGILFFAGRKEAAE